jgi:hypothetical protein
MKKAGIAFTFILFLSLLLAWFQPGQCEPPFIIDQIRSQFKSILSTGNQVLVKGRWKRTTGTVKLNIPPKINTTTITCDKPSLTCREIIAGAVTPEQKPGLFEKPYLFIEETSYKIINWSNDGVIIAKHESLVADFELRISLEDEFAERRWRETKAHGSNTSDSKNYGIWTLE